MTQIATWPAEKPSLGATTTIPPSPWSSVISDVARRTTVDIPGSSRRIKVSRATPPILNVGTLPDDRLRLRQPLVVNVERENNHYIARCEKLEEFGYGDDPMGAVDDLRGALAELYWTLKKEQDHLGSALANLWVSLQEVVEER